MRACAGTISMRVLGLDVGERRIGMAVSDGLGITAQRLALLERGASPQQDADAIAAFVTEKGAERIIVGLPLTMRGETGDQAKKVLAFVEVLRARVSCPVETVDERLTTVQGQRALLETDTSRTQRKQLIDQVAAQLILQSYLDARAQR